MTDGHLNAARAVVAVSGLRERFYNGMLARYEDRLDFVPESVRPPVLAELRTALEKQYPWSDIEAVASQAYATHLTEEELYAVGALLTQPIGRRMLEVLDNINMDIQQGLAHLMARQLGIEDPAA